MNAFGPVVAGASYLSFTVRSDQSVSSSRANHKRCVLEQNLAGGTDAEAWNVDVECVLPLRVFFIDGCLGTSELGTLTRCLGSRNLKLCSPLSCLASLQQTLTLLVAQFLAILVVCELWYSIV